MRTQLELSEPESLGDLRLLLAAGSQIRGAHVYRHATRRIWWAWPVYLFSVAPGPRHIFDWGYRTFASNRFRVSSACGLRTRR
ncbi:MAG: DUF393 domain-containing protein [Verrucomicrobia bacterium]|nr:DUF393 domain-containing protein [Verrucomicrobiota bacterium]